jgi:hypothetical protein
MILREYKVSFKNNKAVLADSMNGTSYQNLIKCSVKGARRFINWLVVFATDEKDAIKNADAMVHEYLGSHLGLSA